MKQEIIWGTKDAIVTKEEDLEEKLKYAKEEIVKLRNTIGELKSELWHKEMTIVSLKE